MDWFHLHYNHVKHDKTKDNTCKDPEKASSALFVANSVIIEFWRMPKKVTVVVIIFNLINFQDLWWIYENRLQQEH